jgi:kinesin family protein C2/C3
MNIDKEAQDLVKKYKKEVEKRRKLYNELQELKGNIRVYCRVRPLSADEIANGDGHCASFPDEEMLVINHNGQKKTFEFEKVFTPSSTQGK